MRIAAIGDLMLDVIVRLEEPLAAGDDVRARTRTGAGGQAANVAAWAASLGAGRALHREARRRRDRPSSSPDELAAHGVELVGPVGAGATGVVVSIVGSDGDRSMASDRGVAPSFAPDELDPAWLDCDVLHVSGYALLREPIGATRAAARRGSRASAARASRSTSPRGPRSGRSDRCGSGSCSTRSRPMSLFATEAEWEMLGGAYLTAPVGVIKRGPRGCTVVTADARLDLAPVDAEVLDTTGAGDALAAGFLARRIARGCGAPRPRSGGPLRARKLGSLP